MLSLRCDNLINNNNNVGFLYSAFPLRAQSALQHITDNISQHHIKYVMYQSNNAPDSLGHGHMTYGLSPLCCHCDVITSLLTTYHTLIYHSKNFPIFSSLDDNRLIASIMSLQGSNVMFNTMS